MTLEKNKLASRLGYLDLIIPKLAARVNQGTNGSASDQALLDQYNAERADKKAQYDALNQALGTETWDQQAARLEQRIGQRPDQGGVTRGRIERQEEAREQPGQTQRFLEGMGEGAYDRIKEAITDPRGYGKDLLGGMVQGAAEVVRHPLQSLAKSILDGLTQTPREAGKETGKNLVDTAVVSAVTGGVGKVAKTVSKRLTALAPKNALSPQVRKYLEGSGGRWGGTATRQLNHAEALKLEGQGYRVTGGAGRASEEWIPGPGGGTKGRTWVDITATNGTQTIRV